ncbi:unnamed protein product [Caenorhabditis angaria]|uniref:Crossover junction endonuclease MUS81 n=1 Tax=Caenorhabditis angaria TaxID=860376 RepID=A0A9P1I5U3_9PELO|nr:unnamed protein product [Caenorhabditis angaria]
MKRVTIRVEHKCKLFYEKCLNTMKIDQEDRKLKYVYMKALENLKKCPFEVETIVDLKNIQGIGENIAVKLESCWKKANPKKTLTLREIKAFSNDDFRHFLSAKKVTHKRGEFEESDEDEQPIAKKSRPKSVSPVPPPQPTMKKAPPSLIRYQSSSSTTSSTNSDFEFRIKTCNPIEEPRVFLIADNREKGSGRSKSTIEHLVKKEGINVDIRALSVGDYLWICRKIDGTEIVMDWVVERKTLADLQSSIRGGRYDEQKRRLNLAPMKNRIYLIESKTRGDIACEQAIASTISNAGFLVQRCDDTRETATFLQEVTLRLQKYAENHQISGVPFDQLQNALQKQKAETVRDVWIRQLMVCPGMSYSRADSISARFPSMLSLLKYFKQNGPDSPINLHNMMPQLTRPITRNLYKFFVQ